MMFSSNYFPCLLLAFLAQQASAGTLSGNSSNCPVPGRVNQKLQALCDRLANISHGINSALEIIDEQCPCLSEPPECYETRVNAFLTALQNFSDAVQTVKADAPQECPDRTGAVFVASCDGTDVVVVDPNGFIQNGITTTENVEGWTLSGPPNAMSDYALSYYTNASVVSVVCKAMPSGVDTPLGGEDRTVLSITGIAFNPANGGFVYVAITTNFAPNGIYTFSRGVIAAELLFSYDGDTGNINICGDYVYMSDDQKIIRRPLGSTGDWEQVLKYSLPPLEFVVLEDGRIVFCETSGAVLIYDPTDKTYRQLKEPTDGDCCGSIKVSPCDDDLIYIANKNDADIEIYNATSLEFVSSLTYTTSTPSACPSIACDPTLCCA
ncbi:uncharacterized protein LOC124117298 [Haliotis rufescens]|uniref:uncharacterized protein LOC124117298 n=1 Tax=Haliotis rufescens TaxID=6454 RepID=UPI00201E979F|nr:uncharacterized protein LOC124117298 [Haliotis rufescens]